MSDLQQFIYALADTLPVWRTPVALGLAWLAIEALRFAALIYGEGE